MSTHTLGPTQAIDAPRALPAAAVHTAWLAVGLAVGFLVPFVFADTLSLARDLYYGIYALVVTALFVGWARATGQSIGAMVRRRWKLAVGLGGAGAALMALVVVQTDDPGTRADGAELVGQLLWRGVVYGAADGLLLAAFPVLVVFAAFAGSRLRRARGGTIAVGALALLASVAMTAAYHAGYADFRSDKLAKPVAGSPVWSVPTLLTLNPLGATISHVGLHVSAVLREPDSETFLPPH